MKSNLLAWSVFALVVMLGGVMLYAIWLIVFDANPPVTLNNLPFPVDRAQYAPGETVYMTVDSCRHTKAAVTAYKMLRGEVVVYTLPTGVGVGSEEMCKVATFPLVTLPDDIQPGIYYVDGVSEYQVNILATRRVPWRSQSFEVIAPEGR